MYKYNIFGLKVDSEIKLECYDQEFEEADVQIKLDDNITKSSREHWWEFLENGFIRFSSLNVGFFEVRSGKEILVSPCVDVDLNAIELYLLGAGFAAIMVQRGEYPLHGSYVDNSRVGICIVGDSGAGKSSLACGFTKIDWKVLTDDVARIEYIDEIPHVNKSYPKMKIWQNTATAMNIDVCNSKSVLDSMEKYYVGAVHNFSQNKSRLEYIFEIRVGDVKEVTVHELSKDQVLDLLLRNTYDYFIVERSGKVIDHFKYMANLTSKIKAYTIERPQVGFTVESQIQIIKEKIGERAW